MCTMVTGKNLYDSTLILCCYGYQTGDNSELQTIILWSMMVLLHCATLKCSFKTTLFSSFLTIKTCQFLIMTHICNVCHSFVITVWRCAINMHSMYFTCETFDILSNSHIKHHEGNIYIYIPGTEHHEGINLMPDIFRY
jgi:hypothetical protein